MAVTLSAEETLNFRRKLPKVLYKPYRKRLYQVPRMGIKLTTEAMMGTACIRKHKFK
jgi:hypothetical protein